MSARDLRHYYLNERQSPQSLLPRKKPLLFQSTYEFIVPGNPTQATYNPQSGRVNVARNRTPDGKELTDQTFTPNNPLNNGIGSPSLLSGGGSITQQNQYGAGPQRMSQTGMQAPPAQPALVPGGQQVQCPGCVSCSAPNNSTGNNPCSTSNGNGTGTGNGSGSGPCPN